MDPLIYVLDVLVFAGIYALLALSLNLEFGFTGLANFGKVAFFMAGAYTYAVLANLGVPYWLTLLAGAVVAGILGAVISLPALRLREDYLAIVTISFGEILRLIVKAEDQLAGGVHGIVVPSACKFLGDSPREVGLANVLLVYALLAVVFLGLQLLANTPYGRVLRGIREDEVAVAAVGKNTVFYKMQVLALGSGIAGLAGGLFAQYLRYIEPYMFMPLVTFLVWIMLMLGGAGNNVGVLAGALVVELLNRGTRIAKDYLTLPVDPNNLQFILFGLLIVIILIYRPQGLIREGPMKTVARERATKWLSSQ